MKKTKTKTKTDKYKYSESATVMRRGEGRTGKGRRAGCSKGRQQLQQELLIFPTRIPDSL